MTQEFNRHIIVSVQGSNGAGKSTVAHLIEKTLTNHGFAPTLVCTAPSPEIYDEGNTEEALMIMRAHPVSPRIIIVDHASSGNPVTSFRQVLETMDAALQVKHGDGFATSTDKKKNELRRQYLRDACSRRGIPFALAALMAPRLIGKRSLWDVIE